MSSRSVRHPRALLLGALLASLACRSGASATSPEPTPILRRHSESRQVPVGSRAQLAALTLDVPLSTDSGVCVQRLEQSGVGRMISVYYPGEQSAVSVATVNLDTAGRIVRFTDRRGRVRIDGLKGATGKQIDSAFAAARRASRSSTLFLDYVMGQAVLTNDGGGKEDENLLVPLAAVANDSRFGAPDARARAVIARCGSTPLSEIER